MFNEFNYENFGYNDCAIDGHCSIDPVIYSLMEVLLYELKQLTYYYIKIRELGYENKKLRSQIINYLSLVFVDYEFNRNDLENILREIHREKENAENSFSNICEKNNFDYQILKSGIDFKEFNLSNIVSQGEQHSIRRNKSLNSNTKNLFDIILNLIKSSSTRLIELENYTNDYENEEESILKFFNNLNFTSITEEKLIRKINDFSKINYEIHQKLHKHKEKYYGKIELNNVPIEAISGKSILVSGQNLKDLENLLEATKDKDINVYTHDGLIVAHAYPKFFKYKNLIGHYQLSLDNVQYDFASFSGPILIIRNFQYLLDKLYRGRIFTTNLIAGKGITKLPINNFNEIIEAAESSKGFEKDSVITTVKVGYVENEIMEKLGTFIQKIKNKEFNEIIFVGLLNHSPIKSEYLEELEKNLKPDQLLISAAIKSKKENVLCFDSFFNSSLIYKIISKLKEEINFEDITTSLFITTCNQHTISHLFNLKYLGIKNLFLPKCTSNVITPNMLKFLTKTFKFKQIGTNALDDLKSSNE